MSLKFFFNRKGPVVLGLTFIGWSLYLWRLWQMKLGQNWETDDKLTVIMFLIHILLAGLITTIRFIPWYFKDNRGAGIEEHFEKTMVPVTYILILTSVIFTFWTHCWPYLLFTHFIFLLILSANVILLILHFRDHDPLPPSYFARNLYLGKK